MDRDKVIKKYSNGEITIVWKPDLCVHATTCFRELPDVFKPYHRPWIDPKGATTQQIIDIVNKCPTKALTYEWDNGENDEFPPNPEFAVEVPEPVKKPATEVTLLDSGPLMIKGDFLLKDQNGNAIPTASIITICRCGASKNSPFCDGSHNFIQST
jgi:uncharacterized Fe-S cluster protein YjdI